MLIENKRDLMKKDDSSDTERRKTTDTMVVKNWKKEDTPASGRKSKNRGEPTAVKPPTRANWLAKNHCVRTRKMVIDGNNGLAKGHVAAAGIQYAKERMTRLYKYKPTVAKAPVSGKHHVLNKGLVAAAMKIDTMHPLITCGDTIVSKKTAVKTKREMAKIRCGRMMINNVKVIEIREFIGFIRMGDLPEEYLNGRPTVTIEEDISRKYLLIQPSRDITDQEVLYVGEKITYKKYVELLQIMSAAGQRLTDINAKEKRAREFSGEFVVTI